MEDKLSQTPIDTGCPPKNFPLLGTSYSETTSVFGLKLWLQGLLMRAPCCRSFKSNRSFVSEYDQLNYWSCYR